MEIPSLGMLVLLSGKSTNEREGQAAEGKGVFLGLCLLFSGLLLEGSTHI